ncbi:MAG: cytidine deaminase [Streptococcaceae bacterium]|jgi:cytidine deaminase|nr:cytidine deaminase [Streptococcaceae bacterium]
MATDTELFKQARDAASVAYVPYSHFPVGAALVAKNGLVFQGCNIENASFGLTNCAERTAIFKAVSSGVRDFERIGIYGETDTPISPCGACRQVLSEFCSAEMPVYLFSKSGDVKVTTVGELLPYQFKDLS